MTPEKYMLEILAGVQAMQTELYGIPDLIFYIETRQYPELNSISIAVDIRNSARTVCHIINFYSFSSTIENRNKYKGLLENVEILKNWKNNYEQGMERQPE